jgi:hypothetical protein
MCIFYYADMQTTGAGASAGRVTTNAPGTYTDFDLVGETKKASDHNFSKEATAGHMENDEVSDLFFSPINVQALQRGIRNMVLTKTCGKHIIGNQSSNELYMIMRGIFLQECKFSKAYVLEQVKALNISVLQYAVPRIVGELDMHDSYIKDISTMPVPLAWGESTNVTGTRSLEQKPFF